MALPAALAAAMSVLFGGSMSADYHPITDLPFGNGSYPLTCGWHVDCHRQPGYDPQKGAIDLGMGTGSMVHAAGHGDVRWGGHQPAWGYNVKLDHGGEMSIYAHLDYYFFTGGEHICRHVTVGYSGSSGNVTGPHLHFGGEDAPDQFDTIHGVRPRTYGNEAFQHDPYAVPGGPDPVVEHQGVLTNAKTVDDGLLGREFFLHGPAADPGWLRFSGRGFGFRNERRATFWYTPVVSEPTRWAAWHPVLKVSGDWEVYVFVPPVHATAPSARYRVEWYTASGWQSTEMLVDQSAVYNEWVRLANANHASFPTLWPGRGQLAVKLFDDCAEPRCAGTEVAADATLFIPADCGP
jgi:murein DD-endopeptidase MepM/ murein hydrolase activator NlpD